jgi:hypothetical protein
VEGEGRLKDHSATLGKSGDQVPRRERKSKSRSRRLKENSASGGKQSSSLGRALRRRSGETWELHRALNDRRSTGKEGAEPPQNHLGGVEERGKVRGKKELRWQSLNGNSATVAG